jgi:hypothetical protein
MQTETASQFTEISLSFPSLLRKSIHVHLELLQQPALVPYACTAFFLQSNAATCPTYRP